MRNAVVAAISQLAKTDQELVLLTADMGFSVFEGFAELAPGQFINAGIAEANMVGVAAGLALAGKRCFLYTFAPFISMRCFEQVRLDLCYQNLPVVLIGLGGGLTYAKEGATHQAVEDIAIMRALPNMKVLCPGDPVEAELCVRAAYQDRGPVYIRIGKSGEPNLHKSRPKFKIGQAIKMLSGDDVTIFSTGNMLKTALAVGSLLRENGIEADLYSLPSVKPLDADTLIKAAKKNRYLFTLEEHSLIGGFGSAVLEKYNALGLRPEIKCFGLADKFVKQIGRQAVVREKLGLDANSIFREIASLIGPGRKKRGRK